MSGFLKNFDRLVSGQALSVPNRFIFQNAAMRYNPANTYFEPGLKFTGLQKDHSYDSFILAVVSQALTHESHQYAPYSETSAESRAEIELNQRLAQDCLENAEQFIRQGLWSEETEVAAAVIYAREKGKAFLEHDQERLADDSFYKNHICPAILRNLRHLSNLNVIDITEGLVNAGFNDPEFWNKFLTHVQKNVVFEWEMEPVDLHGWSVTQYEYKHGPKRLSLIPKSSTEINVQFFAGNNNALSQVRRLAQQALLEVKLRVWLPVVQRERRVRYLFDERSVSTHRESYKSAIQRLVELVPEVRELTIRLPSRA